jgi:hypothetical protein
MRLLKDVALCAFILLFFLGGIILLDWFTGVPLSYGVPLAAILALLPYAYLLRRNIAQGAPSNKAAAGSPMDFPSTARGASGAEATTEGTINSPLGASHNRQRFKHAPNALKRTASIHSVIFLPHDHNRAA